MSQIQSTLSTLVAPAALADAHRRALDSHSIVSISDVNGVISYANDRFCKLFGYEQDALVGRSYALINSGQHTGDFFENLWNTVNAGNSWVGEVCNTAKDGRLVWCDNIVVPLFDEDGTVTGHFSVRRDITKRKNAENELELSRRFLLDISELAHIGGWSLDLETGELYWSDETKRIHEVPLDYIPDLSQAIEFYASEARPAITHAVESSISEGGSWDLELPMETAKGRPIWVRAVGDTVWDAGKAVRVVGAFQDITARKNAETVLRDEVTSRHRAEQLLGDVLETLPDAVAAYDEDDKLMICNSAYLDTYAASADAIVPGARFEDILRFGLVRGQYHGVGDDTKSQERWIQERLANHKNPPEELIQRLRDGRWLQVRETRSASGATVGVRTDITTLKHAESELRKFAETDQLTGLLNRGSFCAQLDEVLEEIAEGGRTGCCVALFDIDHFKPINDAYGHDIGDEVLRGTVRRLQAVMQQEDFAARLGGDEFVFAMTGGTDERAYEERVIALFDALQQPFFTRAGEIKASLSLGLATTDAHTFNPQTTSRHMLKFADLAQYRAKQEGRARWQWFDRADADAIASKEIQAKALAYDLNQGVDLVTQLEPIGDAHNAQPLGFSNHVAWRHNGELISGKQLFDLAQRTGNTATICTRSAQAAMQALSLAHTRGAQTGQLWLSCHLDHVKLDTFVSTLETLRRDNPIPADQITVAVNERAFSDRSGGAVTKSFKALGALGYRLAVDGFGAGASSAALLRQLDVHAVRLTRQITSPLADDQDKGSEPEDAMVRGQIALAKALDFEVLGRGVDTPAHAAKLASLGCDALPGNAITSARVATDHLLEHLAERARLDLTAMLPTSAGKKAGGKATRKSAA